MYRGESMDDTQVVGMYMYSMRIQCYALPYAFSLSTTNAYDIPVQVPYLVMCHEECNTQTAAQALVVHSSKNFC